MIDLEQITKEVQEAGPARLEARMKDLMGCDRYTRAAVRALTVAANPMTVALILTDSGIMGHLHGLAAFAFEIGRLYGRSELMEELEGSNAGSTNKA